MTELNISSCRNRKLLKTAKVFLIYMVIFVNFITSLFIFPKKAEAITLKELGNSIAQLSSEEESLLEEILTNEALVEMRKNEIENFNLELEKLAGQLTELNDYKEELSASIEKKTEILEEKVIYSYKYRNNDIAMYIISARNLNEVANNLFLFKNIMTQEADIIEELQYEKEEYDRVARKSEEKKAEIEALKTEIETEKEKLLAGIEKNNLLLDEVKGEKSELQNLLGEIRNRIAQVQPPGLTLIGEWEMVATAYYAFGKGGNDINGDGITAIGLRARKGIVAVDPKVIPLGTRLFIPGYGEALAADTGGWIKNNRIDLCFETYEECLRYGRRKIRIYLIQD